MRAVRLIEKTARALHAVHEAGVIHRDVKPGNVMITPEGEAVVMDFGLARDEEGDLQTLTRSGDFFGTPAYMSPEQLTSQRIRLDRRTDVWSLGVTLYECVTLSHPFQAPTREGLYKAILTKDPPDPRRFNPHLPGDLCVVLATALEKDLDLRYQTARDFADDLRRTIDYEPIHARPVGPLTRMRRWAQRNPALAGSVAVAILILCAGTVISLVFAFEATASARRAEASKKAAASNAAAAALTREWGRLGDAHLVRRLTQEGDVLLRFMRFENPDEAAGDFGSKLEGVDAWIESVDKLSRRLNDHRQALLSIREQAENLDPERHARDVQATQRLGDMLADAVDLRAQRELEFEENLASARPDGKPVSYGVDRSEALKTLDVRAKVISKERDRLSSQIHETGLDLVFADAKDQVRHDQLSELIVGIEAIIRESTNFRPGSLLAFRTEPTNLGSMRNMARILRSHARRRGWVSHADAWQTCVADIARDDSPYRGFTMRPVPGLVPLGRNRETGLWEFWHQGSGRQPRWSGTLLDGKLGSRSASQAIVVVLLPGGEHRFPPGDPSSGEDRGNGAGVEVVELVPFMTSKYEITAYQLDKMRAGYEKTDTRPASMTWWDCAELGLLHGLALPTEVQWEYACRAGTATPWNTGSDARSLQDHANVADGGSMAAAPRDWVLTRGIQDGHVGLAPVGSFKPNAFGLFDTHGNSWEWCADAFTARRERAPRAGDGLRAAPGAVAHQVPAALRVIRGGSCATHADQARSDHRAALPPVMRRWDVGFRPVVNLPR